MNRAELIDRIADANTETPITKAASGLLVDQVLDELHIALVRGEKIAFKGFGIFSVAVRPARDAKNPRTGEAVKVAAKRVVKFKAGSDLTTALNPGR